jgi:hypothetical protein
LTGTFDDSPVDLSVDVPRSKSQAAGIFAKRELSAIWRLDYGASDPPEIHGSLHGRISDQTVTMSGDFHLDVGYRIESAELSGQIGAEPIRVTIEAVDGGLSDTGSVAVQGTFAASSFDLHATVSCGHGGIVCGTIDAAAVRLDGRAGSGQTVRVAGVYHGPPALLAVIACTMLWFI